MNAALALIRTHCRCFAGEDEPSVTNIKTPVLCCVTARDITLDAGDYEEKEAPLDDEAETSEQTKADS